jgi:centromeric protein E
VGWQKTSGNVGSYGRQVYPFSLHRASSSVAVRVRPLNKQETIEGCAWDCSSNGLWQCNPITKEPEKVRDAKYLLDHVYGPETTNQDLYEGTVQPLIHKAVEGFNGTVFAYGQTSSGKTYTMKGVDEDAGVITRAVGEIFDLIDQASGREFLVRVSYMEVRARWLHANCAWN